MQDATALAAAIRDGQITATQVMEASLTACEERAAYGAVVYFDKDMARAGAKAADAVPSDRRGPFHGVPFLIKDLGGAAKGLPASAGSAALRACVGVPQTDCHLIEALRGTGLIPFGLTATPTFGPSLSCEPEGLAPTLNPWNPTLSSGGSSGGAAAAVAAGIVAIAHATDAAGSIRVPAACCGLTGLKPSRGAVPTGPDFGNHLMGIASELVLARSIRDVEAAFRLVQQPLAPIQLPDKPRIGLALPKTCGADQQAAVRAMGAALVDAGCEVHEIHHLDALGDDAHQIAWMIIAVSLADWLDALNLTDEQVPPMAVALAAEVRSMTAADLFALARDAARLAYDANRLFSTCDAILTPVLAGPPASVGAFDLTGTDTENHRSRIKAFAPNVALANVAGLPALALPFGLSNDLPVGGQLLGPIGSDAALLRLGALIEARAPKLSFPYPIAGFSA